jgi:hypothetical protein
MTFLSYPTNEFSHVRLDCIFSDALVDLITDDESPNMYCIFKNPIRTHYPEAAHTTVPL